MIESVWRKGNDMHSLEQLVAGELRGAKRLRLSCGLTEFPEQIFDLSDTLEILDLSDNALTALPNDLYRLHKLRVLFASNNGFTIFPSGLGLCQDLTMVGFKANRIQSVPSDALPPKLRWLILTDNALEYLPSSIGQSRDLQKLMLAGNNLSALPASLANCERLELLRISANAFQALPEWLPQMPRLSWVAMAGNPSDPIVQPVHPNVIAWQALEVGSVLGEGASGVIYQARYRGQDVAVKLFKGAMTSDGLPSHEMAACTSAGQHPALISVLGCVSDHPSGRPALVMGRLGEAFRCLAGPPSFDTCTRDVYLPGTRLDSATTLGIARDIASAMTHLHARGLMHGDLYAHNIQHDGGSRALLGDFGAASFYDRHAAPGWEQIEVRALGYLLSELAEHCEAPDPRLLGVAAACLTESPQQRPLFADILSIFEKA